MAGQPPEDKFPLCSWPFTNPTGFFPNSPRMSPHRTLAEFGFPKNVYPLGRLDADSEGLLLLSDEPGLNRRLLDPEQGHTRTYWAQVERIPSPDALEKLSQGLRIEERETLPCRAWLLDPQPALPPRDPPIRYRKKVPDCWIGLELTEGKKPPGPEDDRCRGAPHPAPDPGKNRGPRAGHSRPGSLERGQPRRAGSCLGGVTPRRQASLQYFTFFQSRSHFFLQEKGLPQ